MCEVVVGYGSTRALSQSKTVETLGLGPHQHQRSHHSHSESLNNNNSSGHRAILNAMSGGERVAIAAHSLSCKYYAKSHLHE